MKSKKKYKTIIFIVAIVIIAIIVFFTLKSFLYPSDTKSVYGNRLNGIEDVKITSDKKTAVINRIKTESNVTEANVEVQGKIIYIFVTVNKNIDKEGLEGLFEDSLTVFSDDEKSFYDFQFFGTNDESKFKVIGAKSKQSESIAWKYSSEVEENEETE